MDFKVADLSLADFGRTEITLAGGSFMQPEMLGSFQYGSRIVTLSADETSA